MWYCYFEIVNVIELVKKNRIENRSNLHFEFKTFLFSAYKKVAGYFQLYCIRTMAKAGTSYYDVSHVTQQYTNTYLH